MTIQQIIEGLLRARLYRLPVVIRTQGGASRGGVVRDVHYDGSRSFVILSDGDHPESDLSIPLSRITSVDEAATQVGRAR